MDNNMTSDQAILQTNCGSWLSLILLNVLFGLPNIFGDVFEDLKIPPEKVAAVRAIADTVLNAGFPSAAEAEFYSGEVNIFSIVDPDKQQTPFPVNISSMQSTAPDGNLMEYGFKFNGLQVKLKDGNWLLNDYYPFTPTEHNRISHVDALRVFPEKIYAETLKDDPFDIAQQSPQWVAGYLEQDRAQRCTVSNKVVPLTYYLQTSSDELSPSLVLLHSAGMMEAPLLACAIADSRSRNYWVLNYWNKSPAPFDPSGRYPGLRDVEGQWHEAHENGYGLEEIDVAFRRALHRYFRHMISSSTSFLSAEDAANLAKLCTDPGDPQGINPKIDRLLEATRIPDNPAEDATLPERLQAWGLPKEPEMVVKKGEKKISISTMFITPMESYTPNPKDLEALFGLLDDDRPTKFIDFQGSRSVGENSLRAMAKILNRNPLELVEMETLEPWTHERRKLASQKLRSWWLEHQQDVTDYIVVEKQ